MLGESMFNGNDHGTIPPAAPSPQLDKKNSAKSQVASAVDTPDTGEKTDAKQLGKQADGRK
jgi:hypothetical protein